MNTPDDFDHTEIGERNVERLLGRAYRPEAADPEFVRRLTEQLCAAARERAHSRPLGRDRPAPGVGRRYRLSAVGAAAALAGLMFGLHALLQTADGPRDRAHNLHGPSAQQTQDRGVLDGAHALRLMPRPKPPAPAPEPVAVGAMVRTAAGQRRRVALPDGSALYLNENTNVKVETERHITLTAGEVFAEVAPRAPDAEGAPFVVRTAGRDVTALGTRFDVRADQAGTGVVVTQGKVQVSGLDHLVCAGEQLPPGSAATAPAPRASYLLDWARA